LNDPKILKGIHPRQLLETLHQRYDPSSSFRVKLRYWRKKYLWLFFVEGIRALKRLIDIILSLTLLIVLSPLFLLIALMIKGHDRGPVFYVSTRVGKWGKEFSFPKFRTMVVQADSMREELKKHNIHGNDIRFKMEKDPRVTPFGKLLRKFTLDELPQLWTVLKGDMTLVGPRPPLPEEVDSYSLEERRRLDIKPGLTCLWQVSGRSNIPFQEQVELDIQYIESQSLWLDLKLILKTIPAILFGKGAY
jgi:lipopolysaccharide/colanic/teichoic acid biosynthesis glycosyltransferase